MSIYRELDPMPEHRTQFGFKGKREILAKVSMPNMAYLNWHIDIEISHGSGDVIVPNTINLCLILTLNQQTRHVVLLAT